MPLLKPPEPQIAMRKFYIHIAEPLALTMERYAEFLGTDNHLPGYVDYARRVPAKLLPAKRVFRSFYAQHKP